MSLRYPPPIMDMDALAQHTCTSARTIELWMKTAGFPQARHKGGKRYWLWTEVEEWFRQDDNASPETRLGDQIYAAGRRATARG